MRFGGIHALKDINFTVPRGMITSFIGPNGAGKTTIFNCLTGIYSPSQGSMLLRRRYEAESGTESHTSIPVSNDEVNDTSEEIAVELAGKKTHDISRLGIARTFQNIRLFRKMTALENIMIGMHTTLSAGILGAILRGKKTMEEEERVIHESYTILKTLGLENYVNHTADSLPYGAQRKLEIGRALASNPVLLLLDEPAAGLNPRETTDLDGLIFRLRSQYGLSITLIEHDMKLVMNISDYIYVLDYGTMIAEGTPQEVSENPAVIKAYLGTED